MSVFTGTARLLPERDFLVRDPERRDPERVDDCRVRREPDRLAGRFRIPDRRLVPCAVCLATVLEAAVLPPEARDRTAAAGRFAAEPMELVRVPERPDHDLVDTLPLLLVVATPLPLLVVAPLPLEPLPPRVVARAAGRLDIVRLAPRTPINTNTGGARDQASQLCKRL